MHSPGYFLIRDATNPALEILMYLQSAKLSRFRALRLLVPLQPPQLLHLQQSLVM
jgi:hypothetical protein